MTVDDDSAPGNRRESAKAKFIKMRQGWLEQVATDTALTPTALRVAMLLSNGFNHETLETFIGRDTIAVKLSARPGLVSTGVALLKKRGHVSVRTVRRNNHYKMLLKDPKSREPDDRTGSDIHTSKVRKSEPNRSANPYTNRQGTDPRQGSGAEAPASQEEGIYSEDEVETRSPEGARLAEDVGAKVTNEEAFEEICRAYSPGRWDDRDEALECMVEALKNGVSHERLVFEAGSRRDINTPLEGLLWDFTKSGMEYAERRRNGMEEFPF